MREEPRNPTPKNEFDYFLELLCNATPHVTASIKAIICIALDATAQLAAL